jgi:hypothetical protein
MEPTLKEIYELTISIDKTLAVNTRELSHHIEQTMILRDEVKTQRSELNIVKDEHSRLKGFFMYVGWLLTGAAGLATVAYNIWRLRG